MAFRPYTSEELEAAALAYGLDPDFVDAVYKKESSRGTNPKAMVARSVKRKRDSTIVRGPFQLEDDTVSDLIRENKLGNVNVDDPDAHLDLAMRQMQKLQKKYNNDPVRMAQAYLGRGTDELGTTSDGYGNDIIAEMKRLKAKRQREQQAAPDMLATANQLDPFLNASADESGGGGDDAFLGEASPPDDLFGIPEMPEMQSPMGMMGQDTVRRDPLGMPIYIGAAANRQPQMPMGEEDDQLNTYIQSLVDEELQGKDFQSAA